MSISDFADSERLLWSGGRALHCTHSLPGGNTCGQSFYAPGLPSAAPCLESCLKPQMGCTRPAPCGDPCPKKCMVNVYEEHPELKCNRVPSDLPYWQYQLIGQCLTKLPLIVTLTLLPLNTDAL
ncbi:DNA-binding protein smubp-2 [Penicillium atrosanguineum]|nr:DNA-binding protein smubp-2 [Penicillium atrosanguineum]